MLSILDGCFVVRQHFSVHLCNFVKELRLLVVSVRGVLIGDELRGVKQQFLLFFLFLLSLNLAHHVFKQLLILQVLVLLFGVLLYRNEHDSVLVVEVCLGGLVG